MTLFVQPSCWPRVEPPKTVGDIKIINKVTNNRLVDANPISVRSGNPRMADSLVQLDD